MNFNLDNIKDLYDKIEAWVYDLYYRITMK